MKITRFILSALFGCCLVLSAAACSDLSGDNSDFDFGDMTSDEPENPYDGQGYDRLPNSVRLATYNTHRCEGWTQNAGTDRANYNNTAKVISLMDPDVIALQELDKNTTWHPTDQLQELADRTGMRPYYCKTIDYRAAEVLLNYAEAKAELGTLTQADIELSINPLRERAGVADLSLAEANAHPDPYLASAETGYANVTGDNKGVILEIRRERTVELLMENLRYWDIMRWKEGKRFEKPFKGLYFPGTGSYDLNGDGVDDVCIWSGSKPATSAATVYELNKEIFLSEGDRGNIVIHTDYVRTWDEERDYLYPVPTDDRVLTQGAITQNPGWKDGLNF